MERHKILLIEDHLGERLNIMKALANLGAEIETAVTFQRACDLLKKRDYDVMIAEMILSHCPDVQGDGTQFWSFAQKLKPATPLLLIANDAPSVSVEMLRLRGNAPTLIDKPVRPDLLLSLVRQRLAAGVQIRLAG